MNDREVVFVSAARTPIGEFVRIIEGSQIGASRRHDRAQDRDHPYLRNEAKGP